MGKYQLIENHNPNDQFLRDGKHNTMTVTALSSGGRWLTREEVAKLITKHTYPSNEGLSDYTESLDSESMLDELFPETP